MRFSTALLLFVLPLLAGEAPEEISGQRALETLKTLSDDSFGGRKSGLASGKKAEQWMANRLKEIGLQPGYKGKYFHDFLASVTEDGPGAMFVAQGGGAPAREGSYLTDYVTLIYSGKGVVDCEVVFAGYGIHAPKQGHDDYAGLDVNGKIVMAVRGVPANSGLEEERFIGYKSSTARDRGAVGFLLVEGDKAVPGTIQEKYHRTDLPAVWIARKAADDLLARAKQQNLAAQVAALAKGKRRSFLLTGVKVKLQIAARLLKNQPMRNVVGLWPGTGDEYVVCGAHLDHVGTDAAGNVYNGADDNGSGSSMLLEVARAVAARGTKFKRNILFVWFAAEEQGLTGSRRFVKESPVPLDKIAVMFNTDMVGQGKPELAVGGAELYPHDAGLLAGLKLDGVKTKPFRSAPNSDHHPFQAAGVPAFFVHTVGPHPNYHQPGDDWKNIKPELLELGGRYIRAMAERAAQSEHLHCRKNRLGEYLWHRAPVVALDARTKAGEDFFVQWFEGDGETVMNGLAQDWAKTVYTPGANVDAFANALQPTKLIGVKGPAAFRLNRPARKLGAVIFAPYLGGNPTIKELEGVGPILWLDGAAGDPLLLNLKAALLVPADLAMRWGDLLKGRVHPWLVVTREDRPDVRKRFGNQRVLITHSGADTAEALLDEGLDRVTIRGLLGRNLLALLRKVKN